MNVKFRDEVLTVQSVKTTPTRFKLNDLMIGPGGNLLKVVTVQPDCPVWSKYSKTATKCIVVLEMEDGTKLPTDSLHGEFSLLRPRRR